ncbi:hypothetical protein CCAX7_47440 [Capsulimonas corticalis]|uniref:Uncharacterized protein n=1 Tax=Capsulimonas corticalis TaxID=2219043 RepID=A0A402CQ89_9BACT|nr:SMI1/KNR4 family protein [Capsulimonas corticalis]BDI32693.1 hypothetical protein CCAX7_47440 [Capsulimonas corticalis]
MSFANEFSQRFKTGDDPHALAADFIDWWYDPFVLLPEHGNTEDEITATEGDLGFRLPETLRRWYALCGRRLEIVSHQDIFLELHELTPPVPPTELFVFHAENQGVAYWGARTEDLARPNPPVYVYERTRLMERDNVSTTNFLLTTLVYEAAFRARSDEDARQLGQIFSALQDANPQASSIWPRRIIGLAPLDHEGDFD